MKPNLHYCVFSVLASVLAARLAAAEATTSNGSAAPTTASGSVTPNALPQGEQAASPSNMRDSATIDEVIVTAERFSESAQKTPLVITTLDGKQLQGVSDLRQLQTVTPGVLLGNAGEVTQTFIRGVGSLNATTSQESSVAYNADGVFLFTSTMISPLLYDLERVEILKGPQGTLYGRNASGGTVNLITRGASLGGLGGYVEGEYGNHDLIRGSAAVNVPITDTLAVRVAVQHVQHHGYLSDGTEDQDQNSGRLRLLWQPSSAVTLRFGVDGSKADSNGAGSSINPNPTNDKFLGGLDPRAQTGPFYLGGTSLLSSPPNPRPFFKDNQWSLFSQLDVEMGFATLTVLPAYRDEDLSYRDYVNGYEDSQSATSKQKSVEARLSNFDDRWKWVAGAYYLKVDQGSVFHIRNESNFQNVLAINPSSVETDAFFGETTYSLTQSFRIIGGLRYTSEKTRSGGDVNSLLGPPGLINPITGAPNVQTAAFKPFNPVTNPSGELLDYYIDGRSRAHAITWKAGAEQDLTPDSMLFATVSRGFKGGGTYVDLPQVNTAFKPEFLTAYEFGSRNQFFDHTLQLNAEAFYWKLEDQQIPFVGFDPVGQVTLVTTNAGKAHMEGASLDATWKPWPRDTFHFSAQYEYSRYDSFSRTVPSLTVLTSTRCNVSGYGGPTSSAPAVVNCAGKPLLRAPTWTGSASYQHRFNLDDVGHVLFDADTTFASSAYLDPVYTAAFRASSYALINASLTYSPPQDRVSVTAWIKNITDQRVFTGGNQFLDAYARPALMPPRTFGITARYSF